jgi:hypothetical protein
MSSLCWKLTMAIFPPSFHFFFVFKISNDPFNPFLFFFFKNGFLLFRRFYSLSSNVFSCVIIFFSVFYCFFPFMSL